MPLQERSDRSVDFLQQMKKKKETEIKRKKYGKGFKKGWLEANKSHLGGQDAEKRLTEYMEWERSFDDKRKRIPDVSNGETTKKKKAEAVHVVTSVTDSRRKRLYSKIVEEKMRGFVKLATSMGDVNVELFCELTPKTCENFIGLCKKGYYDGVVFHRSIPKFMIQGGDPTGTGRGGQSLWGGQFEDELVKSLSHDSPGLLCMANAGPNTNKSQFFITFAPCTHLDGKHTIFGKVVGGKETLTKMEEVPTSSMSKPETEISIESTEVLMDPYEDISNKMQTEKQEVKAEDNPYLQHRFEKKGKKKNKN